VEPGHDPGAPVAGAAAARPPAAAARPGQALSTSGQHLTAEPKGAGGSAQAIGYWLPA